MEKYLYKWVVEISIKFNVVGGDDEIERYLIVLVVILKKVFYSFYHYFYHYTEKNTKI